MSNEDSNVEKEITNLFFGEDDGIVFNSGNGRLNTQGEKKKREIEQKEKDISEDDIDPELAQALVKEFKFLKTKEAQLREVKRRETDQKLTRSETIELRRKLVREKKKKDKVEGESFLSKYSSRSRQSINALYAYAGEIQATECVHDDTFFNFDGATVVTKCKKCSRIKQWTIPEFKAYWDAKVGKAPTMPFFNPTEFGLI